MNMEAWNFILFLQIHAERGLSNSKNGLYKYSIRKITETYFVFLNKTESKTDLQAKKIWSWIVEKTILEIFNRQHFFKDLIWPVISTIRSYLKTLLILLMDEKFMNLCLSTYVRCLKVA